MGAVGNSPAKGTSDEVIFTLNDHAVTLTKEMALQAGRSIKEYRGQVTSEPKGFRDFVTEADLASEATIISTINSHFPDHSIISEESELIDRHKSEYCWLIDPLDGTKNYLWGIPFACVSIALAYQGHVQMAVVYDPWQDEMFWGQAGQGAFLNDQPIQVTEHRHLSQSIMATGFGYSLDRLEISSALARSLQGEVAGLRALGSSALSICYVACGRLDAYFNYGLSAWDMAAGGLLVSEAGGTITDLTGEPEYLHTHTCLCDNGHIHDAILAKWRAEAVYDILADLDQGVK
jgi:myo-inositol-1(or 4)-monophosphatase